MKRKLIFIGAVVAVCLAFVYYINQRITISVVIPVYNAEKYLARCLDSIFMQSGTFEVIAVNDGSTDNSLQILQEYAKKHSNMRIINQKNQGISGARNTGMKAAKNKYITFIDNDDWLEPDAFSLIREKIKEDKSDIVLGNFYDVYDKEWVRETKGEKYAQIAQEEVKFPKRSMERLELFSPFYAKDAFSDLYYEGTWVVHSFFSREFLNKYNLSFPDRMDIMEDLIFMYRAYAYNPYISVVAKPIYNYYNRVDSESKTLKTLDVWEDRLVYLRQTSEYKSSPRQAQMWMNDSYLAMIFVGIANLQRHKIPFEKGLDKIYSAYKSMQNYNAEELKSCRNYIRLKEFLQKNGFNLPL